MTDRTFYSSPDNVGPDVALSDAPDGYEIKLNRGCTITNRGRGVQYTHGIGENFPLHYEIPMPGDGDLGPFIGNLQEKFIRKQDYDGSYVFPVRAGGVLGFYVLDDCRLYDRPEAGFIRT
jgi:hypothetical protein